MVLFSVPRLLAFSSALPIFSQAVISVPQPKGDKHPFNHDGITAASEAMEAISLGDTRNAPFNNARVELDKIARNVLVGATPSAPHFVIYGNKDLPGAVGPPDPSLIRGYNVYALSFLLTEGASGQAAQWAQLTSSQRASVKSQYAAAGIKLIVSVFGSVDTPTSSGHDAVSVANTMAAWVREFDLDGIDVDYEDFKAFDVGGGSAENWLIKFTTQLRTQLPQEKFILTHAPVAPWFSPKMWHGGGYLRVHQSVGHLIDWYNIQIPGFVHEFYNQGTSEYTTCDDLLNESSSTWPQSALFQIVANGVDSNKVVIGKPATTSDASSGFIEPQTLAGCLKQARKLDWYAGVMSWQFPEANASYIRTVRSQAFPE